MPKSKRLRPQKREMSKTFPPQKPEMSDAELLSWVFLFPLKLSQFLINQLLGEWIGRRIIGSEPYTDEEKTDKADFIRREMEQEKDLTCEQLEVVTYDDAKLDTIEIKPNDINDGNYIIHFTGMNNVYCNFLGEMVDSARKLKANIVAFNYRGTGGSSQDSPCSMDDLVTDGIAQVQRLLDKGVSAKKIMLKGHSLGGCVATLVAKYFHDRGEQVYIFNDRSFSSLTDTVTGWLRTCCCFSGSGHNEGFLMKGIAALFKPLIFGFLWLVNWEADVVGAFNDIPAAYKKYSVVRSPKPIRSYGDYNEDYDETSHVPDDKIIPHYASLHQGIKDRAVLKDTLIGFAVGAFIGLGAAGVVAATGGTALLALLILPPAVMIVAAAANAILGYFQRASNKRAKKEEQFEELKNSWSLSDKPCPQTFEEALKNKNDYKVINKEDRSLGNFYAAYHFFRNPSKMIEIEVEKHSERKNNSPENSFEYCYPSPGGGQSHGIPNKNLVNAQGQTGWQFFKSFFNDMDKRNDAKVVQRTGVCPLKFGSSSL